MPRSDTYAALVRTREAVLPGFGHRQAAAVRYADHWLWPEVSARRVRTVVDLGCGTGEILLGLARRWRGRGARAPNLIGIDSSASSIAMARAAAVDSGLEVDFRLAAVEPRTIARLPAGDHLGILCLGHTIFHLPGWEEVARHFSARSRLWLIDIHYKWDAAMHAVASGREWRDRAHSPAYGRLVLRTRRLSGPLPVARELFAGRTAFVRTRQSLATTLDVRRQLQAAGFACHHAGLHLAGYGLMRSLVFKPARARRLAASKST